MEISDASNSDKLRYLREEPDYHRWYEEIQCILGGERESVLQHIGGAQQYVDRLLIDSSAPTRAKAALAAALDDIVRSWRPDMEDEYYATATIELITAYLPATGFTKLLGHLREWDALTNLQGDANTRNVLHSSALVALQSYYPVSPPLHCSDAAFETYAAFLWRQLDNRGHEPHAVRRLLELGLLRPDNPILSSLIRLPGVVEEFIRGALGPSRGALAGMIGTILGHCLADTTACSYKAFKGALKRLGAELKHLDQGPAITLMSGETIQVVIPPRSLAAYMQERDKENTAAGRQKVLEVVAGR
jgi:hypothetical protein